MRPKPLRGEILASLLLSTAGGFRPRQSPKTHNKHTMNPRLTLGAAILLAAPLAAFAEVAAPPITISGYVAASYENISQDPGADFDSLFDGSKSTPSADAIKTIFTANYKPITGVVSLFYIPNIPTGVMRNELTVLDAYATYDAGNGLSVTAGKFLSYLGYEAFDPVNMSQITYSPVTVGTLAAIPAYHTGLKFDFSNSSVGYGLAVVDSVYSPLGIDRGDGELKRNAGFEGYITSTGLGDLKLWAGFAYDTAGNFQTHKVLTLDFWAQYAVSKQLTVAGEFCTKDGGPASKGWTWLAFANYGFTDTFNLVGRIGGEKLDDSVGGSDFTQYTIGPSWKVSNNLTIRAEYSYYDYDSGAKRSLFGVQGLFRF